MDSENFVDEAGRHLILRRSIGYTKNALRLKKHALRNVKNRVYDMGWASGDSLTKLPAS